ncbi:MAG: MFS transporter [candidate division WOR-3 bacterium]|nr:MFS transporter [candidate division WOR-3 bacterium]
MQINLKSYLKLFKLRNLLFLISSGTISQFGDRLTHMLLITLIGVANPGKISAFSQASLTFTLPVIIFSPIIGALVDRWSKRTVMIRAHIIQAILLAITPLLIARARAFYPFWIVVTLFFTIDIFNNTAKPALLPNLVARRKLLMANSLDQFLARFATVAGMVLGGFLIAKIGWQWGMVFNACTHLCAGLLVFGIISHNNSHQPCQQTTEFKFFQTFINLVQDIREVLRLMRQNRFVSIVLLSFAMITFVASVSYTVLIFLVQQVLNWGTQGVGIMSGILAIGMILGALLLGIIPVMISKFKIIGLGFLVYGILFIIGPFLIVKSFLIIVALLGGIIFSLIIVAQNTILQEDVLPEIRGRIFSIKEFAGNIMFVLTAIIIGILSDLTSYKIMLLLTGVGLTGFALLELIFVTKKR